MLHLAFFLDIAKSAEVEVLYIQTLLHQQLTTMAEKGSVAGDVMELALFPQVLKAALIHKAIICASQSFLNPRQESKPHLWVLTHNCETPIVVETLYAENQINLIKVDVKKLEEWVGLYKADQGEKPIKWSVAVVQV